MQNKTEKTTLTTGARLNYLWRLVGTGISFACFGIGGLILSFIVFPLVHLTCRNREEKQQVSRRIIHHAFRFFTRLMTWLGVIEFDMREAEKAVSTLQGKVVIANHPSLIDVVALISIMPKADCVIKEALWNNVFMRGVLSAAGYIKNTGDIDELIESCRSSLNKGYSLIIFPEGTRTSRGGEIILQRGAANIALRCEADLVSVLIFCQPTTLTKHEPWYRIPPTKVYFTVRMGSTFRFDECREQDKSMSINVRHLTEKIRLHLLTELFAND